MQKSEFKNHILAPKDRICRPLSIKKVEGTVINHGDLPSEGVALFYEKGIRPKIIVDMGEASIGGYPVFSIKSFSGNPTLRIAYSDWYDYLEDEDFGINGDFRRGCCKYLGVEIPVLPANPGRFELYDIVHTGMHIFPLIQGQQRYIMLTLDTPDTMVEIEYFYIYYTSDMSAYDGCFECSDESLTKLWYASAWTCQIASFDSKAWDALNGKLLLRRLTKGNPAGIYKKGMEWTGYSFEFECEIYKNPNFNSGISWMVYADADNGYVLSLGEDGMYHRYKRIGRALEPIGRAKVLSTVGYNCPVKINTEANATGIRVFIDDVLVDEFFDGVFSRGTIGFCQDVEQWAVVNWLRVTDSSGVLLEENGFYDLTNYDFERTRSFVADGAKRDRLPWSGDLDWAGRNFYYAFKHSPYMLNTIKILAYNQTPDGFIWGTCYPENDKKPDLDDYGYYQSDMFSAWLVPTTADYLLFTGDTKTVLEIYPALKKSLDYLSRYVEGDGLYMQRYATSKGLWDHVLNDIGKFGYNNVVIHNAFKKGVYIATQLGFAEDASVFEEICEKMFCGIFKLLWNKDDGYLQKSLNDKNICLMANSLGLSIGLFSDKQADSVIRALLENTSSDGKITALMINGCFKYGYEAEAINTLYQPGYKYVATGCYPGSAMKNPLVVPYVKEGDIDIFADFDPMLDPCFDYKRNKVNPVNWLSSLYDSRGPATTWECMHYPPFKDAKGEAWGDRSHPDTGLAHTLSSYILGVLPTDVGFRHFGISPKAAGLTYAKGIVPTPYGDIHVEWEITEKAATIDVQFTGNNILDYLEFHVNKPLVVMVNGKVQQINAKE